MKENMQRTSAIIFTLVFVFIFIVMLSSCNKKEVLDGIENIPTSGMTLSVDTDSNGATCVSPFLTWNAFDGADDYYVQLAEDELFENIIESDVVNDNRYSVKTTLKYSTTYNARVIARKQVNGNKYGVSVAKISFKTVDKHNTTPPDYTQTRTLFDFEDYTTESFGALFIRNDAGDNVVSEIVDGQGVNGSRALKLSYEKSSMGWGAITCSALPSEKKVWSGTTAIRLYVRAEKGTIATLSVKVGKRGYQTWSKSFVLKNESGTYVSIPFSVMEDQGGGDGIWELSGMTFMQFSLKGAPATIYIDDITIGSSEEYKYDTTDDARRGIAPSILEDFESTDILDSLSTNFTFSGIDNSNVKPSIESNDNGHELKIILMSQSSFIQLRKAPYELSKYDYEQVDGITFKISVSQIKDGASISVKFGSYNNIYIASQELNKEDAGKYVVIRIPFADLTLAEGSSGKLNFDKVDTLQIFVKGSQYCYVTLDDIGFYKN